MSIYLISDIHLSQARPDIESKLLSFLWDRAAAGEALYILGDLFEYWIGDDCAELLGHGNIAAELKKLTATGLPVYFMPGNRDFLVGEDFLETTGVQRIREPYKASFYDRQYLLLHGDSLCVDDIEHQKFRSIVLDRHWQREFLRQSPEKRIADAQSMRLLSTDHKSQIPMELMDVNADAVVATAQCHRVNAMIHGHTHRPDIHQHPSGRAETLTRYVLGAWYEQSSFICCSDEGIQLQPHPEIGES